jgi:hypothetical protein
MARKLSGKSRGLSANGVRVELISVPSSAEEGKARREAVRKILGLMYMNLGRRGRSKKDSMEADYDAV